MSAPVYTCGTLPKQPWYDFWFRSSPAAGKLSSDPSILYFLLLLIFRLWCHQSQFLFWCSSFGCWECSSFLAGFWVPLFLYLAWKSHNIFGAVLLRLQIGARRQQITCLWGNHDRCRSGKFPFLFSFASVECLLPMLSAEPSWRATLTMGRPVWILSWSQTCYFLRLSELWLSGLCTISSGIGCNHVRYLKSWGRPKLICGWWSRTPSWSRLSRPTFCFTTRGFLIHNSVRRKMLCCLARTSESRLIFRLDLVKSWI